MSDNPYKASEIGTTINDVRKKIQKTLEINTIEVLEILVEGKILSPTLLIEDVWKKMWFKKKQKGNMVSSEVSVVDMAKLLPPMRMVYRLIGVDGEATEEHIDKFPVNTCDDVNPEVRFKIAQLLANPITKGENTTTVHIVFNTLE